MTVAVEVPIWLDQDDIAALEAQVAYHLQGRNEAMVYGLANRGAEALAHLDGAPLGRLEKQVGWKNFRVLTVTTSCQRLEHMVRTVKEITDGRGPAMFLFAEAETLASADPLSSSWVDGRGETVRLTAG